MNKNKEKAPVIIAVMTGAKLYNTDVKILHFYYSLCMLKSQ